MSESASKDASEVVGDAPGRASLPTYKDHLTGLALAIGYIALLCVTAGDLAMSRDESFYVSAAESYGAWFELLADDAEAALRPETVDRFWSYNREHPALMKTLFAFSWLVQKNTAVFPSDTLAFRFPAIVLSGLLLWLIHIFGIRIIGRAGAFFAAISFGLLQRVFYHAHLACFDVPIVLMTTWTIYAYWRSLPSSIDETRPRWVWIAWTGVAFGCALATKHNAWALPGIFAIHHVWRCRGLRNDARARAATSRDESDAAAEQPEACAPSVSRVVRMPWWALSMLVFGPLLLIGTWPFVWHHTLERLGWYAGFHLQHVYYNMAYFGRNYFEPPFPIAYPFVMLAFTVGATFLLLALVGLAHRARLWLPRSPLRWLVCRLGEGHWRLNPVEWPTDARYTDVLLVGSLLAPLLMIALPSTPIFGGTKHFFPSYPFLALYAGAGFSVALRGALQSPLWHEGARRLVPASMFVILLVPAAIESAHGHPFGLSHYGYLTGGPRGAATLGMNRQFWGFTTGSVVDYLKAKMPDGGTVYICDTTAKAWEMLWRDGKLPRSIRPVGSIPAADYVLVHHEHHFAEVDFQAWVAFGSVAPDHVLHYDGVPIISIYENPRRHLQP